MGSKEPALLEEDWIDVSVPLWTGMVHWPGDPVFRLEHTLSLDRGDKTNLSAFSMGAHTGTHIDAPLHFAAAGDSVDEMPLSAMMGRARVIEISDPESIRPEELRAYDIRSGERILFKTRNSPRCWEAKGFVEDFVYIPKDAARYLAERRVRTVGVDYLSVGGFYGDGDETHRLLLNAGIWIIEGLNLTPVDAGLYDLICLPLKILGGEGAPARAILRKAA